MSPAAGARAGRAHIKGHAWVGADSTAAVMACWVVHAPLLATGAMLR